MTRGTFSSGCELDIWESCTCCRWLFLLLTSLCASEGQRGEWVLFLWLKKDMSGLFKQCLGMAWFWAGASSLSSPDPTDWQRYRRTQPSIPQLGYSQLLLPLLWNNFLKALFSKQANQPSNNIAMDKCIDNVWDSALSMDGQLESFVWRVMFKSSVLLHCFFYAGFKQDLTGFIILLSNQSAD